MGDDAGRENLDDAAVPSPAGSEDTRDERGPSTGVLALLSAAAFVGLVTVGGAIGVLVGAGDSTEQLAITSAQVASVEEPATAVIEAAATTADLASEPQPVAEERLADGDELLAEEQLADDEGNNDGATPPATGVEVEVLAVTELGLDLRSPTTVADEPVGDDVEFVELPKAVYDEFTLEAGELLAINVAANDKIGGLFEAVRPTGSGALPPGFTLERNGVLSGSSAVCGTWRLQYELISDNPAVGTSWIEITIEGCGQPG